MIALPPVPLCHRFPPGPQFFRGLRGGLQQAALAAIVATTGRLSLSALVWSGYDVGTAGGVIREARSPSPRHRHRE
jgi:hypothetical protein